MTMSGGMDRDSMDRPDEPAPLTARQTMIGLVVAKLQSKKYNEANTLIEALKLLD
jgi:hypothetical protein